MGRIRPGGETLTPPTMSAEAPPQDSLEYVQKRPDARRAPMYFVFIRLDDSTHPRVPVRSGQWEHPLHCSHRARSDVLNGIMTNQYHLPGKEADAGESVALAVPSESQY